VAVTDKSQQKIIEKFVRYKMIKIQ